MKPFERFLEFIQQWIFVLLVIIYLVGIVCHGGHNLLPHTPKASSRYHLRTLLRVGKSSTHLNSHRRRQSAPSRNNLSSATSSLVLFPPSERFLASQDDRRTTWFATQGYDPLRRQPQDRAAIGRHPQHPRSVWQLQRDFRVESPDTFQPTPQQLFLSHLEPQTPDDLSFEEQIAAQWMRESEETRQRWREEDQVRRQSEPSSNNQRGPGAGMLNFGFVDDNESIQNPSRRKD